MDAQTKAKAMGMTLQNVHQMVKRNPNWEGAQKVGNKLVFPDKPSSAKIEPEEYPDESTSKRKKSYYDAEKSRQEYLKIKNLNDVASGQLVDREALDTKYKEIFTTLRTKILALPGRLKRSVGDEFTDRCEETLEILIDDLLEEVANG